MPDYHHLTDDEVLHIAEERHQLTDEARQALDVELHSRKLTRADLDTYRVGHEEAERADQLKRERLKPQLWRGLRRFFGKANRRRDPSGEFEEYESTLWFVFYYFPIFPIASFTVRRHLTRWLGIEWRGDEVPIERHPRDGEQIRLTWVKAAAVVCLIRLIFYLLDHLPDWFPHR